MTKPKKKGACPECNRRFVLVSKHLRVTHKMANREERRIVNSISTGKILLPPGRCPIRPCLGIKKHPVKHIKNHKSMGERIKNKIIRSLKLKEGKKQLANLRASNPQPPLTSTFDLPQPAPPCNNASCGKETRRLRRQLQRLQAENGTLRVYQRNPW